MSDRWDRLRAAHREVALPVTAEHRPTAAVLACSDARVPPSVVFDQPAGSLFVVRIAGNTASATALASLDYAVEQLGVELLVVLGHTECGAVAAAAAGVCGNHLAPVVAPICELARANADASTRELERMNVAQTIAAVRSHSGPVGDAARSGALHVVGALHDIRSGDLTEIDHPHPHKTLEMK